MTYTPTLVAPEEFTKPVRVWGKPSCVQCTATTRDLTSKGIEFDYLNVLDYPDQVETLRAHNKLQMPFVESLVAEEEWGGYRPDKIAATAATISAAASTERELLAA